jgi:uncharacterized protein (DUF1800 family)
MRQNVLSGHFSIRRSHLLMASLMAFGFISGCGGGDISAESSSSNTDGAQAVQAIPGVATTKEPQNPQQTTAVSTRDAARLAHQATFGPSEKLLNEIRSSGIETWLAQQFSASDSYFNTGGTSDIHKNDSGTFCNGKGDNCWRDYYSSQPLVWDFYRHAVRNPDQLRQRMAFALGQIDVVSNVEVEGTYGLRNYHNMLLNNAFTNYREVLRRVTLSPVMGDYLDHVNNDREKPNENYAREMLQLFAIGSCELNQDGSLKTGKCVPTYDNTIVRNYAFALTGWTYPEGGSIAWGCGPEGTNCRFYSGDMVASPILADQQPRALLSGKSVAASRTPGQALDTVLDSVTNHPNMAPFIAKRLIQHFVKSNPTPGYVERVATAFRTGRFKGATRTFGTGQNTDLTATVAAILLDSEARNPSPAMAAEKLREPALMITGVLRALNGITDGEALGWWWGEELREHVFRPPSVFNFYSPDYPVIGTPLQGPEFGIYNANTSFGRLNFMNSLLFWDGMKSPGNVPYAWGTHVDWSAFASDVNDPAKLVDRISTLATGGPLADSTRATIIKAVSVWNSTNSNEWKQQRMATAAYLVFATPAYQVMN